MPAMGRWDEATAEYAKAIGLRPADYRPWYYYTRVRLAVGDSKGYRKACEDLLERFGQTEDPGTANIVAWTLTVVPNATTDFDRPLRLAEKAIAALRRTSPTSVHSGPPSTAPASLTSRSNG